MDVQLATEIERIIACDPGKRGISGLVIPGDLARASHSLLFAGTVFIITGFYIISAGCGETDGPPGAVVLGRALTAIGKKVCLVTDEYNRAIVQAAAAAYGLSAELIAVPVAAGDDYYHNLLAKYRPTHLVAVERPGRAADGKYYNMRGEDITSHTARLDSLICFSRRHGAITIGIGDGGNEAGMGKVMPLIRKTVPSGAKIAASIAADYLIVAGVTNWGAYGLVACLSALAKTDLLHSSIWERRILAEILRSGAVDGTSGKPTRSIDGLPVEEHCRLIGRLRDCLKRYLPRRIARPAAGN
ncbi:MAG: DUF4392 domain-containing protein [bacterium]|jgi:hypothetical protein